MSRIARGALACAAATGLAAVLASCSSPPAPPAGALPVLGGGCPAVRGTPPVPLVLTHAGGGTAPYVGVCVDGHGPYPFLVDTGAAVSLVDTQLVDALQLPSAPPSTSTFGIGCVTAGQQVTIDRWSMGGVALGAQTVLTTGVPGFGLSRAPAGVLGSDVLGRFGAVRIDYAHRKLTVLAPQAAPPAIASILRATAPLPEAPPLLVHGSPQGALLTVLRTTHSALVTAATTFGQGPAAPFLVDTGSPVSVVSPGLSHSNGLGSVGRSVSSQDVGCQGSAPVVRSGSWTAGGVALASRSLASVSLAGSLGSPVSGTIGSDVLSGYGSVVLDYRTGVLWLGAG